MSAADQGFLVGKIGVLHTWLAVTWQNVADP